MFFKALQTNCNRFKQANSGLKHLSNFIGRLEEDATTFFIIEKKEETTFDFS